MPFDLSVTISMYFYERCQTKRDVQISDLRREIPYLRSVCLFSPPQGGGGTLIFSCICRLGLFWGVQSFIFQYFGGGFRKLNIFGGIEDFVDIFGGHHKIGLYDAF